MGSLEDARHDALVAALGVGQGADHAWTNVVDLEPGAPRFDWNEPDGAPSAPVPRPRWAEAPLDHFALGPTADARDAECERLLPALARLRSPASLELVRAGGRVGAFVAVRERDAPLLAGALLAEMPGVAAREVSDPLESACDPLVVELALAEYPCFQLAAGARDVARGVLAALDTSHGAGPVGVQVLLAGARHGWPSFWAEVSRHPYDRGKSSWEEVPDLGRRYAEKARGLLFAASVRAFAADKGTLRALLAALQPMSSRDNALAPLTDGVPWAAVRERVALRPGMLLAEAELSPLVRLPDLRELSGAPRPAARTRLPACETPSGVLLGVSRHRGRVQEVRLNTRDTNNHILVVGGSGLGKSTFLAQVAVEVAARGEAALILIEPQGDTIDHGVLPRLPRRRLRDVVLFDPGDADWPIAWNVMQAGSDEARELLVEDLIAVFRRSVPAWGHQIETLLAAGALAVAKDGGTLHDLHLFYASERFREAVLARVGDAKTRAFWSEGARRMSPAAVGSIVSRLDQCLRRTAVRNVVAQRRSTLDVESVMERGGILLARFAQGDIGEGASSLLGTLLLSRVQQIGQRRARLAPERRRPCVVLVDEAHLFAGPSMSLIASGSRKYGIGLVVASQSMQALESADAELATSLLANCRTRVAFRVGERDARLLADGFGGFSPSDLLALGVGEAIARVGGRDDAFSMRVPAPPDVDADEAEERRADVVERMRERYARPRAEVEAGIGRDDDAVEEDAPPPRPVRRGRRTDRAVRDNRETGAEPETRPSLSDNPYEDD